MNADFLGPLPGRDPAPFERAFALAPGIAEAGFAWPGPTDASPVPDPFAAPPLPRLEELAGTAGLRNAAAWAATAQFAAPDRRAARVWLTDALAIGAAPGTLFRPRNAPALLESGTGSPVRLWRPVAGRAAAPLFPAILWNRLAGDALELHAGPECAAAAVAAAQALDRPLADLLDALAAGCGVGAFCRGLLGPLMEPVGIHAPGAVAPVASAAAVGRLAGLAPEPMRRALLRADAAIPAHPYRAFAEGATGKLLYGAWGQLLGAAAALDPEFPTPEPVGETPGDRFDPAQAAAAIRQVHPKKHPGSRAIQPALEALESLDPEDAHSILVETYSFSATISGWAEPVRSPIAAQMHIPTAVALRMGTARPLEAEDFAGFDEPEIRERAARVRVVPREFGRPGERVRRARLTVERADGRTRSATADAPWPPPAEAPIRARFRRLTADLPLPDPFRLPLSARLFD